MAQETLVRGGETARRVITLYPGDVALADRGQRLETLLGSCVAIILTDPRRTVAVMCHIVHSGVRSSVGDATGAQAEVAMASMEALLRQRGINPSMCEAYVYGGGNMFPSLFRENHVGADNARWALDRLAADRVRVLVHDVGGSTYRRLGWTVGPDAPDVRSVEV